MNYKQLAVDKLNKKFIERKTDILVKLIEQKRTYKNVLAGIEKQKRELDDITIEDFDKLNKFPSSGILD